jgi:hypothetical protein
MPPWHVAQYDHGERCKVNRLAQDAILPYLCDMAAELRNQRIPVLMTASEVRQLDAWRRSQDDLPSRGEAVRRLLALGLQGAAPKPRETATAKGPARSETRQKV